MSSITNAGATTPNHHDETRSSILQVLESNRLDLSRVQNLSQCLRQAVGKQRPAPVVKRLMQEHHSKITVEELQASHVKLLQADFWQAATATTGLYMQRISIVVWFVQYILESTHNSDKNAVPAVNKIVVALLNQMARAISSLVKGRNETGDIDEQKDDEDDNETLDASNFDPPTIAAFAIGVLLRGIQPYVSTRPILLSPLWKGICDLAGPMPRMSPELAEETLRALLTYLQEGKRQVSNSGTVSIQQQEFHIKLLVFLVARLMTLLPLYIRSQPNSSSDLLQDVLLNLCELRGIGMMSNSADSRYRSLEGKIDQCVVTAVFCAGKTWESRALEALLHTSRGDLSRTALSRSLGKALLLRGVLRHTVPREKLQARDAEMVLSICEDLVFVTLPLCRIHGGESVLQTRSSLLADVLDLIVASLLQIASSEDGSSTSSSASRQSTLEQLLIRWLAPTSEKRQTLHPMSRELAVSVVCMYVMLLCPNDDSRSDSPRSVDQVAPSDKPGGRSQNERAPSMIVMLAKMVFDPRTTCEHRRNLASVLLRLTNPHSSDRKQLGKMAANVVGIEFVKSWKEDCKAQRRKRKRTEKSNAVQASGFGALGVDDLLVMMEVLLNVGRLEKSILDEHLATFCHDLAQDNYTALDPKTSKGLAVCQQSPASLSLLLSAFGGVLRVSPEAFQDRLGQKPTRMSDALIAWLSERWKRLVKSKRSKKDRLGRVHSIVTISSLGFLQSVFECCDSSLSNDMLNQLQTTLCRCIKQALKLQVVESASDSEQQQHAHMVLLAIMDLLPAIARVISPSCPRSTLEGIAAIFKNLFSSGVWAIVARTMTSLVEFASHLPSAHKTVLPLCVTAETQGLLQSRLQNKVYRPTGDTSATSSPPSNDPLLQLIPSRLDSRQGFFSTSTTQVVTEGSYCLTMPTVNGRSALVIFPPDDKSLDDIKYMLGSDDLSEVDVRRMRKARPMDGGKGCLLHSTSL